VVYKDYSIKQLVENVYFQLIELTTVTPAMSASGFTISHMLDNPLPVDIRDKLGTLLQTKKMNAPAFFSLSFKFGVYLPILVPFLTPLLLTLQGYIKERIVRKKTVP
jgi:hypothetical protein